MVINHSKEFIFIHVPKSAGTSVTARLSRYSKYCDLEIGGTAFGEMIQNHYQRRFGIRKHSSAAEVRAVVGPDVWERYFTFSFVRSPFRRTESTYRYLRSWAEAPPAVVSRMKGFPTLRSFLTSAYWSEGSGPDGMFKPQISWLRSTTSEGLGSVNIVDYVGKVENLQADMNEIEKRIHCGPEYQTEPLAHLNKGTENVTRDSWTPDMVDLVINRYREDFLAFGYPMDPFPEGG